MACFFCTDSPTRYQPSTGCQGRTTDEKPCCECSKIVALQDKILDTRKALKEMLEQHRELSRNANLVHDPFISRVPPEIAAQVFHFYVIGSSRNDAESRRASLRLGAVCRNWRQIAWSTPALWTRVVFHSKRPWDSEYFDCAQEWLARSGQLPLSIRLCASFSMSRWRSHEAQYDSVSRLIQILNSHSQRWSVLDIDLDPRLARLLGGPLHPAPHLHDLRVSLWGSFRKEGAAAALCLRANPKSVILRSGIPLRVLDIRWDGLEQAQLYGYRAEICAEFLDSASSLKHLVLVDSWPWNPHGPSGHVIHQHLRNLALIQTSSNGGATLDRLLDALTLPGLEVVACDSLSRAAITPALVSLINRSGCLLQGLFLRNMVESDVDLIGLLGATPRLRELRLEWSPRSMYSPYKLLRHLARTATSNSPSSESFLPELQHLHLLYQELLSWEEVASVFGPLNLPPGLQRRPLQDLEVHVDLKHQDDLKTEIGPYEVDLIEEEVVYRFLAIMRSGCHVKIFCTDLNVDDDVLIDLLKISMERYGVSTPTFSGNSHNGSNLYDDFQFTKS